MSLQYRSPARCRTASMPGRPAPSRSARAGSPRPSSLENCRTLQTANSKSVLGIVGLDIRIDDTCRLTVSGTDEEEAFAALVSFIEDVFPHCDDDVPVVEARAGEVRLPRVLAEAGAKVLPGTARRPRHRRGPGGAGRRVRRAKLDPAGRAGRRRARAGAHRGGARTAGRAATTPAWTRLAGGHRGGSRSRAPLGGAGIPSSAAHLVSAIGERGATAAGAVASAESTFTAMLAATGSVLLRERALDIRDVCVHLLREVYGEAVGAQEIASLRRTRCASPTS